ncbi:MAG TPA: hypothetical protein VLJ21_05120 [Candidatus Binatia bacterium]|nr:hypothetical protein [Candidatus Binatia bacterium]
MEFNAIIKDLHASKEFKAWKKEHSESYLAHAFMLLDDANKDTWQVGFYNSDNTITTFVVSRIVEVIPNQEILRSDHEILELKPQEVTLAYEAALKQATEFRILHHPREVPLKTFFIIQQLPSGAVYNITFFFQSMKTLNVKLAAGDGKIVSHSFQTLMEFDRKK